ncbi:MAG: holo-ACP synthase [Candidatus Nanopelagicales bacterium]
MIVGVGVDVVDVDRFVATLARRPRMRARLFTESEQALPGRSLAATFAAKEAVAKALGAPPGLDWHDCEVCRDTSGRPYLNLTGTVEAAANQLGAARWHMSLSHDGGVAVAQVIAESG